MSKTTSAGATPDVQHYDGQDLEALADLPRYTRWILDQFGPHLHGRVIEVGAGMGNVSARYLDQVHSALLVEPAVNLHSKLAARLGPHPKVTTACCLLQELPPALVAEPFDAAILVNVLEHIDDDVAILQALRALVKPGGAVLIFVPALPQLYGSLDALVHHVRRYTRMELRDKFERAGLVTQRVDYMDALGMAPWFVVGKILKQRKFSTTGAQLYDRFGVPATRFVEERFLPPIGKSLVGIATRA